MDVTLKTWTYVCGQVLLDEGDTCTFLQEVPRAGRTCVVHYCLQGVMSQQQLQPAGTGALTQLSGQQAAGTFSESQVEKWSGPQEGHPHQAGGTGHEQSGLIWRYRSLVHLDLGGCLHLPVGDVGRPCGLLPLLPPLPPLYAARTISSEFNSPGTQSGARGSGVNGL